MNSLIGVIGTLSGTIVGWVLAKYGKTYLVSRSTKLTKAKHIGNELDELDELISWCETNPKYISDHPNLIQLVEQSTRDITTRIRTPVGFKRLSGTCQLFINNSGIFSSTLTKVSVEVPNLGRWPGQEPLPYSVNLTNEWKDQVTIPAHQVVCLELELSFYRLDVTSTYPQSIVDWIRSSIKFAKYASENANNLSIKVDLTVISNKQTTKTTSVMVHLSLDLPEIKTDIGVQYCLEAEKLFK